MECKYKPAILKCRTRKLTKRSKEKSSRQLSAGSKSLKNHADVLRLVKMQPYDGKKYFMAMKLTHQRY